MRRGEGKARYFPLDEALAQKTTRILRVMSRADYLSVGDIAERIGVGIENPERQSVRCIVAQMVRRGELEQRHEYTMHVCLINGRRGRELVYRLSDKGRAQLADLFRSYERGLESAA